ncbi:TRAP transporter large permease [Alkalihalobacillus oceani]|uniref:TRAP transporter large permease n=1 Tax=Halalkalibacter oceani TaxID=1653776 RepID=UPI00203DAB0C|nr:TRAP transporter large permease [Halalkalibacter oceani]MCM3759873.1 TRAP transporter large permease [Halalkalibacter oceani]
MSPELIGLLCIILLFVLLLLRVPVGMSLLLVGFLGYIAISNLSVANAQLGISGFGTASSHSLSVMPMFILMGLFLSFSGLAKELFKAVDSWVGHFRGGLGMATIGAAAIFSSISGSSSATTATLARIAIPEMSQYKYHPQLSSATVAVGGTLGFLIPPSVILILYGVLTHEPIGPLLIAGLLPGIIMAFMFMVTIYIQIRRNPSLAPVNADVMPFKERFKSLSTIWPFLLIFLLSIGGIYLGIFTPTEAGGVGALGALVVSIMTKRMNWKNFVESLGESVRLTAMIFLILIGANLFAQFLAKSRIPTGITQTITSLEVSPYVILFGILFVLFILGLFMEGIAILVLTLPIIYPLVMELGFNGIWFGVIIVMVINMGLITPPLGINVFIINGVARDIPIPTIFRGVIPMLVTMLIFTVLLVIFPDVVLLLPNIMNG